MVSYLKASQKERLKISLLSSVLKERFYPPTLVNSFSTWCNRKACMLKWLITVISYQRMNWRNITWLSHCFTYLWSPARIKGLSKKLMCLEQTISQLWTWLKRLKLSCLIKGQRLLTHTSKMNLEEWRRKLKKKKRSWYHFTTCLCLVRS